jgi:DNA helicase-2/ATP-dependent DNA helicase PcrA
MNYPPIQNIQMNQEAKYQSEKFEEAIQKLNAAQREAVEQIEGPVFVLAGPGTGKTQILALRIGHILKNTDTQPHNILCLTYTDAGTIAMRKRLIEFIGSTAYNVHIYTFHAFANQVIQENMHLFGSARELQPLSDLEQVEVMVELINEMPKDHPLRKLKGNIYAVQHKLLNLFRDMKQEGWSPSFIDLKINEFLEAKKNDPEMYYKRRTSKNGRTFEKGDLKAFDFKKITDQMEQLKAGADLFGEYEKLLRAKGRYDYNDMILWVLEAFVQNKELLLRYQEQYLYFLVDEYQDTNGVQNKILESLADYWDIPNVFAVGDDDQSIYRFQGANMENIHEFKEKYNPRLIVLEKNYRSSQHILDVATALIQNNISRLSNTLQVDKKIIASGDNAQIKNPVKLLELPNVSQQEAAIYYEIKKQIASNQPLNDIAVIYRKHAMVENLTRLLEAQDIPINVRRKVNILNEPFIREILEFMQFIQSGFEESGYRNDLLFKTLIAPVFGVSYHDLMKIGQLTSYDFDSGERISWMEVIADKALMVKGGVKDADNIYGIFEKLNSWQLSCPRLTLQVFFEKLVTESGLLDEALYGPDSKWKMQMLNTLFEFIKEESVRNPKINLKEFLATIRKMESNGVELPVMKIATAEDGVHFITAHSAKGLEFDTVYLIGANADNWESSRNSSSFYEFKYPETLVNSNNENKVEEERRLFFVAATRAEKQLTISFSSANDKGKELEASRFIEEMKEVENRDKIIDDEQKNISDVQLFTFKGKVMEHLELPENELIDHSLIDEVLMDYQLSVTSLNKYLQCPIAFYYENIIRVPSARNAYAGFGLAAHYALEQFFREKQRTVSEGFGSAAMLVDFFKKGMHIFRSHFTDQEFEDNMHYGEKVLTGYHADQLKNWFKTEKFAVEHRIKNVAFRDVPIKGMIDKVEIFSDHVNVIDYKTGNPDNARKKMNPPKNNEDPGGDYWRQILFYKILVDNDPSSGWNVRTGEVRLLEPDKEDNYKHFKISVDPADIQIVGDQLVDVWHKIKNHEFTKGCNDPKCSWCNFVKERM